MDYRITPRDRASFKRCRRQWDFASPHRRNLEPADPVASELDTAVRDALAVYYYPGTWDWQPALRQSLVHKSLQRSLGDAASLPTAVDLLDRYDEWARTVDDFAPVKIAHDVQGLLPHPREPERGLTTAGGQPVVYACRIDLLAVDAGDEYWVVRHVLAEEWADTDLLRRDEEAVAACWAWEQDYLGMRVAGTIHNELLLTGPAPPAPAPRLHGAVAQHEPSGGGRSIPQHERVSARASRTASPAAVDQRVAGPIRRTRIRRSDVEIASVGSQLAAEALDMTAAPATYPAPAAHCRECAFNGPCLTLMAGGDAEPELASRFRERRPADGKPRLGQATWGFGRGAAPPCW